jgi:hypothetical protein
MREVVRGIRFPTMTLAEISDVVGPSNAVDRSLLVPVYVFLGSDSVGRARVGPSLAFSTRPRRPMGDSWKLDRYYRHPNIKLLTNDTTATIGNTNHSWIYGTKPFVSGKYVFLV